MRTTYLFKRFLIAAFLILHYLPGQAFADQAERFDRLLEMNRNGRVYVSNASGNIVIKTWSKDKIGINARIITSHKKTPENTKIDIKESTDTIRIRTTFKTDLPTDGTSQTLVHYDIHVPDRASLKIKTGTGDIHVSGVGGSLDIRNIHGNITIFEVGGSVNCELIDGTIDLAMVTGDVQLRTVSGKINIHQIEGSVRVDTVSSDIVLNAISRLNDMELKSINGNMNISGKPPKNGVYEIKSFNGNIAIGAFDDASFEVQARTMNGKINSNLELNKGSERVSRKLKAIVGDGGASLYLSSFNGDIHINK